MKGNNVNDDIKEHAGEPKRTNISTNYSLEPGSKVNVPTKLGMHKIEWRPGIIASSPQNNEIEIEYTKMGAKTIEKFLLDKIKVECFYRDFSIFQFI